MEPTLGAVLILAILLDVFLTVLYARVGTGFISHPLACLVWRAFKWGSKLFGRHRPTVLGLCGPMIIVVVTATWVFLLMLGSAMIVHPALGSSITATGGGPTPTDFFTAMYMVGDGMTTVGTSDLAPRTPFFKMFSTFNSLIGIAIITLTVTYLLEIYNALQNRNTLALKLHFASGGTGDAAEILAGIGPQGKFEAGYAHLAEIGAEVTAFKESHHFYSVLLYFRFREPHYAMSRMAVITLDMVSLIKSVLDDREFAWVKQSAAVTQLWEASMHLLTLLATTFLPGGMPDPPDPDEATLERWRRRYSAAVRRLRQANIATIEDEQQGVETYIALRARWDRYIETFARHMGHSVEDVDPVGVNPKTSDERPDFATRMRAAS
jgi:hypothetical protein